MGKALPELFMSSSVKTSHHHRILRLGHQAAQRALHDSLSGLSFFVADADQVVQCLDPP